MSKIIFRLLLSFIVFVTVFIFIRQLVVPESFGKYGHYRANSIEDNKAIVPYYKGEEKCTSCHQDVFDLKFSDLHAEISCESCHLPLIDAYTDCKVKPPIMEGTIEFCAQCHKMNTAREVIGFPNLDIKEHEEGQNCIECHNPHAPWEITE
jgi:hypothetical protein